MERRWTTNVIADGMREVFCATTYTVKGTCVQSRGIRTDATAAGNSTVHRPRSLKWKTGAVQLQPCCKIHRAAVPIPVPQSPRNMQNGTRVRRERDRTDRHAHHSGCNCTSGRAECRYSQSSIDNKRLTHALLLLECGSRDFCHPVVVSCAYCSPGYLTYLQHKRT